MCYGCNFLVIQAAYENPPKGDGCYGYEETLPDKLLRSIGSRTKKYAAEERMYAARVKLNGQK